MADIQPVTEEEVAALRSEVAVRREYVKQLSVDVAAEEKLAAQRSAAATTTTLPRAGIPLQTPGILPPSTVTTTAGAATPSQATLLRTQAAVDPNSLPGRGLQADDGSSFILSARGTFYLVKLAQSYGPGVYGIDELNRDTYSQNANTTAERRGVPLRGGSKSPILITGIEFNQVDITSQVPCLDNIKVFYTFGQNFGQAVITGEILLGPLGDVSYDGIDRLTSFFWKNRVSVKKSPIAISVGDRPYFVYLTGLRIGAINPEFHVLPFVMFGTLLDLAKEKADEINAAGTVITGANVDDPSLFKALQAEKIGDPIIDNIEDQSLDPANERQLDPAGTASANQAGPAEAAAKDIEKGAKKQAVRTDSDVDKLQRLKALKVHDRAVLEADKTVDIQAPPGFGGGRPAPTRNQKKQQLDTDIQEIDKAISYARQRDQRMDELDARKVELEEQKASPKTDAQKQVIARRMDKVDEELGDNDPKLQKSFKKYQKEAADQDLQGDLKKVKVVGDKYDYPVVVKDPDTIRAEHGAVYNFLVQDPYDFFTGKGVQSGPVTP